MVLHVLQNDMYHRTTVLYYYSTTSVITDGDTSICLPYITHNAKSTQETVSRLSILDSLQKFCSRATKNGMCGKLLIVCAGVDYIINTCKEMETF